MDRRVEPGDDAGEALRSRLTTDAILDLALDLRREVVQLGTKVVEVSIELRRQGVDGSMKILHGSENFDFFACHGVVSPVLRSR